MQETKIVEISISDIGPIRIGQVENTEAATGCTVMVCENGMRAGLDVRGGGPASRESQLLNPLMAAQTIHAIVLSGGSAYGLGAANGVMQYLEEHGYGFDTGFAKVPLVAQADIYDLSVGSADVRPDAGMGYEAARRAFEAPNYRDGNYGAGCGASVGKIAGMETVVNEGGHTVTTDETLYASCSISVGDFIEAIVKACNDDQAQTFTADEFKLGLAAITEIDAATKAATADEDGLAAMYTDFAAAVVDGEGKIIVAITDAVQPKISFDAAGEITDTAFAGTKRELKEDYNMVKFSDATLEWYQQAQNFVDYAAGKTAEELRASETTLNEEGHQVFVDEALYASVSISVDGMINVVAKAADNAA